MNPDAAPGRTLQLDRRGFLGVAAGLAVGGAAAGCTAARGLGGGESAAAATVDPAAPVGQGARAGRGFHGPTQTGVATPARAHALAAAFRVVDADRDALARTLHALSAEARRLVDAEAHEERTAGLPPPDTGLLAVGEEPIEVTIAVGASLFDDRFGLADRRPAELVQMPFLANDRLDPAWTHGDILVSIASDRPDAVLHGLRQLMRATRSGLVLAWVLDGYARPDAEPRPGRTDNRNLLGFKDGTANPHGGDARAMAKVVWIGADRNAGTEPAWTAGGTYVVARLIRLLVERWDRAALSEQELIIGRAKRSGAVLGLAREEDEPDYAQDLDGRIVPLDAHIRLANPRTPETAGDQMLRKGFNFHKGFDRAGLLDQGLAFVSFQRRLAQFLAVQERLKGEPLEEYVLPFGGGFFFVLPGAHNRDDWLGRTLLEA
jgi:deferrochelatase/peroxidase EfeB